MKKVKRTIALIVLLAGILALTAAADNPGPPGPGGSPVNNGNPVGAPIDDNVIVLIVLGTGYGIIQFLRVKMKPGSDQL